MGRSGILLALALLIVGGGAAWWLLGDAPAGTPAVVVDEPADDGGDVPPALLGRKKKDDRYRPPRDVRITVVEGAERTPVPDAIVSVSGIVVAAPEPTNAQGRTWIRQVPGGQSLRIDVRRTNSLMRPQSAMVTARARGYTIELPRVRTIAWQVVGASPPRGGATIRITRDANPDDPEAIRVALDGTVLSVGGWGSGVIKAWAYTEDGRAAQLRCGRGSDAGDPIEFQVARRLSVRVEFEDGVPAAGVSLEVARTQDVRGLQTTTTDAEGRAVFAGLPAETFVLRAYDTRGAPIPVASGGTDIYAFGRTDLSSRDGATKARLMRPRSFTIRVAGVRDPSALAAARVWLDGTLLVSSLIDDRGPVRATWYRVLPRAPRHLELRVPGFLPAVIEEPALDGADPVSVHVTLKPAARILVSVGTKDGRHDRFQFPGDLLHLERFDAEQDKWVFADRKVPPRDQVVMRAPGGALVVDDIPPGRYRFVHPQTLIVSTTVDATVDGEPKVAVIDFDKTRKFKGRVKVPAGANPMEVRVRIRAHADRSGRLQDTPSWLGRTGPDGWFQIQVPTDRVVEVFAEHPTWRPKGDARPVLVDDKTTEVVLELERMPVRKIRIRGDYPKLPRFSGMVHAMPVHFVLGANGAGPMEFRRGLARVVGPSVTFVPPDWDGPCMLLFDAKPFAPIRLENIVLHPKHGQRLPEGTKRLPHEPQPLVEGRSIQFEITGGGGLRFVATAFQPFPISYQRSSRASPAPRITGLGPGSFRVILRQAGDRGPPVWAGSVEPTDDDERVVRVTLD